MNKNAIKHVRAQLEENQEVNIFHFQKDPKDIERHDICEFTDVMLRILKMFAQIEDDEMYKYDVLPCYADTYQVLHDIKELSVAVYYAAYNLNNNEVIDNLKRLKMRVDLLVPKHLYEEKELEKK